MPHLILKAKIENAVSIDQTDRNDVKHVRMMILGVRAFSGDLATQVSDGKFSARTLVNFLGEILEIVASPQAETAGRMWGFDFGKIWPHAELEATGNVKITNWIQHRFPSNPT